MKKSDVDWAMRAILPTTQTISSEARAHGFHQHFRLPVLMEKPKDAPDAPRYQYDCERCKFSWCCGVTCSCLLARPHYKLGDPPRERQDFVDLALIACGFSPQFRGKGAQRR